MKLVATLAVLLALAVAGLLWQTYQRGIDSATREALTTSANQQREVLAEVRALNTDTQKMLAEIRTRDQQRNAQGEERREKMRADMQADACANTVVPAAVSDSLQKRAALPSDQHRGGADTGKSDKPDADASTAHASDLGRDRAVE
ncbi:MAG: DUF2570 domain-containing protein [Symbiopectobacterium sp.]|uniref:DUF2570 domain-containing protein n=1 Tax=Symbiopectobacterium sp. TaxID=2952789 RepID=UPI0039E95DC8